MNTIGKKIEPDPATTQAGSPDAVLGSLRDDEAKDGGEVEKKTSRAKTGTHRKAGAPAKPDEPLRLPKGAFVAMRKSGGLRFSSRLLIVLRDGRIVRLVEAGAVDAEGDRRSRARRRPSRLTREQISQLRITLARSGLDQVRQSGRAAQNPDAYAYEIVARVGRKVQSVELLDGSIPEALQPLVRGLNGYLG
jgi:hypothetical protein